MAPVPYSARLILSFGLHTTRYALSHTFLVQVPAAAEIVTTAQATVLATMMLIAHTLPVELRIAQKSGPRLLFQGISLLDKRSELA